MKTNQAKKYFEMGILTKAIVDGPLHCDPGYRVFFESDRLLSESNYIETARGEIREFKTLDAAMNALAKIGFRRFTVSI